MRGHQADEAIIAKATAAQQKWNPILMVPPGSMTVVPLTGTDKKGKTDLKAAKERAVHELLEGETEKQKVGRNFRPILLED